VRRAATRRSALITWAERDGIVIEDDYDSELRYDRRPVVACRVSVLATSHSAPRCAALRHPAGIDTRI